MKNGNVYSKEVAGPLGSLERPMSFDDCAKKFRDCTKNLNDKKNGKVIELVNDLEKVTDIKKLTSLLNLE
jgi:2-methylcitrate dehydratase PrpD